MIRCSCCNKKRSANPSCTKGICNIPLISVKISSMIQNSLATLTILQEFKNNEAKALECEYEFPINDEAVVTNLRLFLENGTILNSAIEDEEKATEMYQDALSQGNLAVMSKTDSPDNMTIFIGNLGRKEIIKVEFTMAVPVSTDGSF